jgi:chromosome partitioning protein
MNKDKWDIFFSQSIVYYITGTTPSNVSRYINQNNIKTEKTSVNSRQKYSYKTIRNIINHFGFNEIIPQKKIHVFLNFKGGTGKTSICYQISSFFALCGFKVLVIDCDPQAHLSYSYGLDIYDDYPTLYDIVVNKFKFEDAIVNIHEGLDILPSNLSLTRLETPLNQMTNREKVFSKLIEPIKQKYDFILIDTNPTISTVNKNVTLAADEINIVCETQPYSLKGLEILVEEIKNFSEVMELEIDFKIIPNKYESKTATAQESLGKLRYEYKQHLMNSIVRKCEDINISANKQLPIFFWGKKNSFEFEDICDLGKEIIFNSSTQISK